MQIILDLTDEQVTLLEEVIVEYKDVGDGWETVALASAALLALREIVLAAITDAKSRGKEIS